MTIQTNATDRKKLAKSIAEFTGNEIHYMGPPTFAYAVSQSKNADKTEIPL